MEMARLTHLIPHAASNLAHRDQFAGFVVRREACTCLVGFFAANRSPEVSMFLACPVPFSQLPICLRAEVPIGSARAISVTDAQRDDRDAK